MPGRSPSVRNQSPESQPAASGPSGERVRRRRRFALALFLYAVLSIVAFGSVYRYTQRLVQVYGGNIENLWLQYGLLCAIFIAFAVVAYFAVLFPNAMPSSIDAASSLSLAAASSSPKTLTIMTWAAAFFTPLVLAYQAWTYWVFRKRITTHHIPDPVALTR